MLIPRAPEPERSWAPEPNANRPLIPHPWPVPGPWSAQRRRPFDLDSVPDGRVPVPFAWWLPAVALLVLAATSIEVLHLVELNVWGALFILAISAAGYLTVRLGLRQAAAPVYSPQGGAVRRLKRPAALLAAALVGIGASFTWSLPVGLALRARTRVTLGGASSVAQAFWRAVLLAVNTSVLEECGIALIILATAAAASRWLPSTWDPRSTAVWAIGTGALVRTVLHIPLWGLGAIGRIGLSLILAWLFWRTRRIWPLIVAHVLWDSVALQALFSPSLPILALVGLSILGWGIAGTTIAIVAAVRSRQALIRRRQWELMWPYPPQPVGLALLPAQPFHPQHPPWQGQWYQAQPWHAQPFYDRVGPSLLWPGEAPGVVGAAVSPGLPRTGVDPAAADWPTQPIRLGDLQWELRRAALPAVGPLPQSRPDQLNRATPPWPPRQTES